jgi:hypothetical protein
VDPSRRRGHVNAPRLRGLAAVPLVLAPGAVMTGHWLGYGVFVVACLVVIIAIVWTNP